MSGFAPELRRLLSMTNAIEDLNLPKVAMARGHLPQNCAVSRLLVPAPRNIGSRWRAPAAGRRPSTSRKSHSGIGC